MYSGVVSSAKACLVFEGENGDRYPKFARVRSVQLHEYAVPPVVLNACQSATLDDKAEDAFATVATALQRHAECGGHGHVRGTSVAHRSSCLRSIGVCLNRAMWPRLFVPGAADACQQEAHVCSWPIRARGLASPSSSARFRFRHPRQARNALVALT